MIHRSYRAFRENDPDSLIAVYHPEAVWDMTGWGQASWTCCASPGKSTTPGTPAFSRSCPLGSDRYFVRGEVRLIGPQGIDYQLADDARRAAGLETS
jgi:hypothetical protein